MDNLGFKKFSSKTMIPKTFRQSRFRYSLKDRTVTIDDDEDLTETSSPDNQEDTAAANEEKDFENGSAEDQQKYVKFGTSPPVEVAPNMYDSHEDSSMELNIEVSSDMIRQTLLEQFRQNSTLNTLLEDIELSDLTPNEVSSLIESQIEKDLCLLWAAFHKRTDMLEKLLEAGANLHFHDINGTSALHISSFVGCFFCTEFLIKKGANVNGTNKCFTPLHYATFGNRPDIVKLLLDNGAVTFTEDCKESILHCAVRANSVDCLKVLVDCGLDVNCIEPNGINPIHLAADLGMTKCLEVLLNSKNVDINARTGLEYKTSTALHLAADEGNEDCVCLLLDKGANPNLKNYRGFTSLHLAARSSTLECLESLLVSGRADPNIEDLDKRTPLHAAMRKGDVAPDIVDMLVRKGAIVEKKDEYGFTPLHLAAIDGLTQCVDVLIKHGADVTTKSNKGISALNVISRKTPASLSVIKKKLGEAITLHGGMDRNSREVELEFDFRSILQNCHPLETSYLDTFVLEGQKEVLLYPLCMAFLHVKWEKIRKFFFARLLFYAVLVILFTLFVFIDPRKKYVDYRVSEVLQSILAVIIILEAIFKVIGIFGYRSLRHFFTHMENYLEWFFILCVILILFNCFDWTCVGAFAVLVGWTNLMLMVGQLPIFGLYITMYQKVLKEFLKLFATYFCILIGFTASFCTLLPDDKEYLNFFVGFINTLTMMVGELSTDFLYPKNETKSEDEADVEPSEEPSYSVILSLQIMYVLFLMTITIVLMNLLVGIAVDDIQGLKKTANLSKLVRQTKLISYMESALFNAYLPEFCRKILRKSALVSPQAYRVVLSVKPLNPMEKRLPRDIMMEAHNMAKERKKYGNKLSTPSFIKMENNEQDASRGWNINEKAMLGLLNDVKEMKSTIKLQQTVLQNIVKILEKIDVDKV